MRIYKVFILSLIISLCSVASAKPVKSKYLFKIPVYPETESYGPTRFSKLMPPFAITMRAYKTKSGKPLDKEQVIAFYQKHFVAKGWQETASQKQGNQPYLGLRVDLFEQPGDGTHIQLAGHFYLWVAPKDGMYFIFVQQWRISKADQKTKKQISNIIKILENIEGELGYRCQRIYQEGAWEEYYQNEYLVDRVAFTLFDKKVDNNSCVDSTGRIGFSILTYQDSGIAKAEMDRLRQKFAPPASSGNMVVILGKTVKIVAKGKNIILLADYPNNQTETLNKIISKIEGVD